jgi:lipase maturation factor 1
MTALGAARLFHRLLAVVYLIAWVSLALQVKVLIGSHGLGPIAAAAARGIPFAKYPTLFAWLPTSDGVLVAGCWLGAALAVAALLGVVPRVIAGVQVVLYLTYTVACGDFYSFQWDNLLLECGLLAMFLPRDRPSRLAHWLFLLLLFKLYFESGVAKWQSHLHDWQDGSAMTYYYETAPLPTFLASYAHRLPVWWHHFESRATLFLELVVPFAFFGPRPARLAAAVLLTGFQLVNLATANYGFFVYLALCLHVFLLVKKEKAWAAPPMAVRIGKGLFAAAWIAGSTAEALVTFAGNETLAPVVSAVYPFRLANTYHLFGHITRDRIEIDVQTSTDGASWTSQPFRFKPGPPDRAPPFVAPYQPRVDFRLWFYGLASSGRPPGYVINLLRRMCHDPAAVDSLFAKPLPRDTKLVRITRAQYHFSTEKGRWWDVTPAGESQAVACDDLE